MNYLINSAVIPVINTFGASSLRLQALIDIKEFMERISVKPYIEAAEIDRLAARYGAAPEIVTWGDYFQAEIATSMKGADDDEFMKVYETVKFDIISSYLIFRDKGSDFFQWVEMSFNRIEIDDVSKMTDEQRETIHLKILMDYFSEIGINGRFNESELKWYSSFREAVAM